MNLVLLDGSDAHGELWRLTGRRARHVFEVHRASAGDTLRVGLRDGLVGTARVVSLSADEVVLDASLTQPPPDRSPVELLLAMPRPKVLRRVLQHVAAMGVTRVVLVNAARVEKSYFASPALSPEQLDESLSLGLEQGRDTVAPEVLVRPRFKPFVEDELPALWAQDDKLLAHPEGPGLASLPPVPSRRRVVAVGPEGGWVPFELTLLEAKGFRRVSLGPRPLTVEAAVPALVGAVETWHAIHPR